MEENPAGRIKKFFEKKFTTFEELEAAVVPLLMENKTIYENYYKKNNKKLWDKFEPVILINNRKLKLLLKTNLNLIQKQQEEWYSNLASIHYLWPILRSLKLHVAMMKKSRNSFPCRDKFDIWSCSSRRVTYPIYGMFRIVDKEIERTREICCHRNGS